jgi:hypothetical protein
MTSQKGIEEVYMIRIIYGSLPERSQKSSDGPLDLKMDRFHHFHFFHKGIFSGQSK